MKLLLIGGTTFLGRHVVQYAQEKSWEVTMFNRGRTNPELFPEVEKIRGDRDRDIHLLKGRNWDAVIDTCGYFPQQVEKSARALVDHVGQYIFVSSASVYSDLSPSKINEDTATAHLDVGQNPNDNTPETYGARKALGEREVLAVFQERGVIVRPGLIVGPYDPSGRFTYWVERFLADGKVLVPAVPDAPVQIIDARDLAEWLVKLAANQMTGIFNAVGPKEPLRFAEVIDKCAEVTNSNNEIVGVAEEFLLANGVCPWMQIPLWLPRELWGMCRLDIRKAISCGLEFMPLRTTIADTMNWISKDNPVARPSPPGVGLTRQREKELLEKLSER